MNRIRIAGFQNNIIWKNKKENLKLIDQKFADIDADIFLLPEMFSTGYCMDVEEIADKDHQVLGWLKNFAKTRKSAVGGSVATEENGKYFNRFYFVEKDGKVHHYDKRHLFTYATEDQYYTAGQEKVVFEYLDWKICLQVCYDLRFPVFQRNVEDYDLILNVASWPSTRMNAWRILLAARAIENQAYVFGLNRTGKSGTGLLYTGESQCFFSDGNPIGSINDDILVAEPDMNILKNFRNKFPFLEDRDQFEIK